MLAVRLCQGGGRGRREPELLHPVDEKTLTGAGEGRSSCTLVVSPVAAGVDVEGVLESWLDRVVSSVVLIIYVADEALLFAALSPPPSLSLSLCWPPPFSSRF